MTLWQRSDGGAFRLDDQWSSRRRSLDLQLMNRDSIGGTRIIRLEVLGTRCEEEACMSDAPIDTVVGVPVADLLTALRNAGVTESEVKHTWAT